MDRRHHQRTGTSDDSRSRRIFDLLRREPSFQRVRVVCQSFLKKSAIHFAAFSASGLFFPIHQAKAASLSDMSQNGTNIIDMMKKAYINIEYITGKIIDGIDWLNNLPGSLPKLTADLFTTIYQFLSEIALETPLIIFDNPYVKNTSLTFSLISIAVVTFMFMYESVMKMLKKKHTDIKKILKRYAIVVVVSGFTPFAFKTAFYYLNELSIAISHIGSLNGGNFEGVISNKRLGFFDTLILILFDLSTIALLIPVCLQAGRRWWDLFCLAAISPLALSCWAFERHEHYAKTWWNKVKSLSLVQLVYSVFILMLGVFIFGTQSVQGGIYALFIKLLIVAGGLYRLSNPPKFVKTMTGPKSDVLDAMDEGKGMLKNTRKILLFQDKKFNPVRNLYRKVIKWKNKP